MTKPSLNRITRLNGQRIPARGEPIASRSETLTLNDTEVAVAAPHFRAVAEAQQRLGLVLGGIVASRGYSDVPVTGFDERAKTLTIQLPIG